ncbi:hypothetical protein AN958_00560 [Leucoagaricus sp. SymC.cos]|nr:hypothetical protein AN958_00560 [Leucoagaricus sp. SymC.cos]
MHTGATVALQTMSIQTMTLSRSVDPADTRKVIITAEALETQTLEESSQMGTLKD